MWEGVTKAGREVLGKGQFRPRKGGRDGRAVLCCTLTSVSGLMVLNGVLGSVKAK